jgi:RHS repeat-associated protein
MTTMTYPSGKVITYTYANDRATSVLNGAANLAQNIQYKPFGGVSAVTYGNGITSTITYDTQYRLATLATGTFQNLTYGYDYNGNITGISPGKTYTYDALDRLWAANGPWGSLGWTYDGVGNRLTENANTYTYATNTNKLTNATGITFGYDNNGNTTTQASRVYTYNQNQRLIQVVDGAMTANYTYNGNGQRVKKSVNGTITIFHYSLNGQIIAESNSSGTITAEYVYLNGQPLAKLEGVNTYYYHNDHLGTPQKMTDASGTVVWAADYKPFGEATVTVSTITNNLRFPGQYYDAETGLHYNYFRDYDPAIGRYKQADPIGIKSGKNHLYIYTSDNPIMLTDFYGLDECIWGGFSADAVFGVGIQFVKQAGKCKDKCGKWNWKNRNCVCSCVGLSLGICGGGESGNDSSESEGWSVGYKFICLSGGGSGVSGGGISGGSFGLKFGATYCWCSCSIVS